VSLGGTASSADLGGSSKYSKETLEGRGRRKVPREQHLDVGKSVLSDGGNLFSKKVNRAKEKQVKIPAPDVVKSGTWAWCCSSGQRHVWVSFLRW